MITDRYWFDGLASAFHDVDGIRLFARVGGRPDAPPMLLLHGFPQDARDVAARRAAARAAFSTRVARPARLRRFGAQALSEFLGAGIGFDPMTKT